MGSRKLVSYTAANYNHSLLRKLLEYECKNIAATYSLRKKLTALFLWF